MLNRQTPKAVIKTTLFDKMVAAVDKSSIVQIPTCQPNEDMLFSFTSGSITYKVEYTKGNEHLIITNVGTDESEQVSDVDGFILNL